MHDEIQLKQLDAAVIHIVIYFLICFCLEWFVFWIVEYKWNVQYTCLIVFDDFTLFQNYFIDPQGEIAFRYNITYVIWGFYTKCNVKLSYSGNDKV